EVIKKNNKFKRVVASLLELKPHSVKIRIKGNDYIIKSAYDLTKLRMGNLLLAFVYPNKRGVTRLYPLPKGAKFSEENIKEKYIFASEEEKKNKIHEHSKVNEKTKELMKLKNQISTAWRQLMNYAAPIINETSTMANSGVNIALKGKIASQNMNTPSVGFRRSRAEAKRRTEVPIYAKKPLKFKKKAAKFFKQVQ
ncbi:MAG: hypothetical protein ACFFCS_28390, partial [Candidatus Hodarchaeota archaeon]